MQAGPNSTGRDAPGYPEVVPRGEVGR